MVYKITVPITKKDNISTSEAHTAKGIIAPKLQSSNDAWKVTKNAVQGAKNSDTNTPNKTIQKDKEGQGNVHK